MVKFTDIQDAFFFVSSAGYGMHSVILNKSTGRLYFRADTGDLDEISDEDLDWEMSIEIPHKSDLGLGQELVFEFVEKYLPDDLHQVRFFFRKRGAYHRFKSLLATKGLLQNWFEFENQREELALRQWCKVNEIELSG